MSPKQAKGQGDGVVVFSSNSQLGRARLVLLVHQPARVLHCSFGIAAAQAARQPLRRLT